MFLGKATGSGQGDAASSPAAPSQERWLLPSSALSPGDSSGRPELGRPAGGALRVRRGPRDPSAPRGGASRPVTHARGPVADPWGSSERRRAPLGRPRTRPSCAHSPPDFSSPLSCLSAFSGCMPSLRSSPGLSNSPPLRELDSSRPSSLIYPPIPPPKPAGAPPPTLTRATPGPPPASAPSPVPPGAAPRPPPRAPCAALGLQREPPPRLPRQLAGDQAGGGAPRRLREGKRREGGRASA